MLRRIALLLLLAILAAGAAYWWVVVRPLPLPQSDFAFSVKPGASLRSVARELTRDGVVPADWTLVLLARAAGADRTIKAGSYEIAQGTTLAGLLRKLTQGDVTQSSFTIVEGWTLRDVKAALKANPDIVITVADLPEDPHLSPFEDEHDADDSALTTPLPAAAPKLPGAQLTLREFREGAERSYIIDTLKTLDWNISKAAVLLGVERTNLHKKIRAYGIKRGEA